jgi:hypothetical protein
MRDIFLSALRAEEFGFWQERAFLDQDGPRFDGVAEHKEQP